LGVRMTLPRITTELCPRQPWRLDGGVEEKYTARVLPVEDGRLAPSANRRRRLRQRSEQGFPLLFQAARPGELENVYACTRGG
jgi:hypothetical protein